MKFEPGMKCRFCSSTAIGVYALDRGCVCHPDDREQALCAQHVVRANPLGSMELVGGPGMAIFEPSGEKPEGGE